MNPYLRAAKKHLKVKQQSKERLDKRQGKPDKPIKPDKPTRNVT
jgi:hypothetical protein